MKMFSERSRLSWLGTVARIEVLSKSKVWFKDKACSESLEAVWLREEMEYLCWVMRSLRRFLVSPI